MGRCFSAGCCKASAAGSSASWFRSTWPSAWRRRIGAREQPIFQWLLTLGIVAAAVVGMYYSYRVQAVARAADAATLFAFKDQAWRRIFWVSLPPGVLFVLGSLLVTESPRWLFRRGETQRAHAALLRSRSPATGGS